MHHAFVTGMVCLDGTALIRHGLDSFVHSVVSIFLLRAMCHAGLWEDRSEYSMISHRKLSGEDKHSNTT